MGALDRVLREVGDETLDRLAALPGADLATLLLAVMRKRANNLTAPDVLRRYRTDRFVTPAQVPFRDIRRAENALLDALPDDVELLQLAPVVPLGTHSVMSTVDQNNVVSTIRGTEVAADPTNALALEAAVRRRAGQDLVELASVQRVVRAQVVDGAARFAHFTLFGRVSAGRDTGNREFERANLVAHMRFLAQVCAPAEFRVTCFDPRFRWALDLPDVVEDPTRQTGYYEGLCFKVFRDGVEVGDGGFVDWSRHLLADRKERMLISGVGVDRLALGVPGA
ncbi:hypothetical protein FKR81_35680 [Lentzea tibetensis]|uniref:Uncharacterized protein n=1 Tax=Lentzea tibetensis TaxID=2591470 RepID=A0A563EIR9_9PSEU|nr:hypothetical protein [Lentzea tibetensis]TWP46506.1 hypothetical protein FKR81_35680 [Lentzea tibetensis]